MIKNYTPHPINYDGRVFESCGVARVQTVHSDAGISDGVKLVRVEFGEVQGLPNFEPDILLIVSSLVQSSSPRTDLITPTSFIRDASGNIIGCAAFQIK